MNQFVPPSVQRPTLDKEIEDALEKHLGQDYKNLPNIQDIRQGVRKELVGFLVKQPHFYNDRTALSSVLSFFVQQQEKLHSKKEPRATQAPAKQISKLKTDCLELIKELNKQDPALATRLTKILVDNSPKLNSQDPNEVAQALKIILTMHILLEDFKKTKNTEHLKNFADNPEKMDVNKLALGRTQKTQEEFESELTDADRANISIFGSKTDTGTHQQAPTDTNMLGVILAIVSFSAMSHLVQKAEMVEPIAERSTILPNPFPTKPEPPK